jgi:flagellar basal-body rod protein FlgF/flagellar basal-body rod protein FlgG
MPYGLYLAADGANVQSKRLEMLANNLANVDTVGFKRELALFEARATEAIEQGLDQPGTKGINDLPGGVKFFETITDYSTGPLKHTGMNTDVAILGDGFFQIEKDGERYLTRAGNFSIDAHGNMLTQEGERVLSSGGSPVVIDPELGPAGVGDDGAVYQIGPDGQRVAVTDLGVVQPASLGDLVKRGENRYFPLGPVATIPPDQRRLRSGYLESSGVQSTSEMMQLIEATRAMEMNVNMIRNHDQMLSGITNRMLRQS